MVLFSSFPCALVACLLSIQQLGLDSPYDMAPRNLTGQMADLTTFSLKSLIAKSVVDANVFH